METILLTFQSSNWEKTRLKLKFFSCHNINMALLWLILKWYKIPEDFFLLISVRYHDDVKTTSKVWLVQSQDPDVRLISQIDIAMCFIYNISAMSWRYRGWCHSNIITISECPLGWLYPMTFHCVFTYELISWLYSLLWLYTASILL